MIRCTMYKHTTGFLFGGITGLEKYRLDGPVGRMIGWDWVGGDPLKRSNLLASAIHVPRMLSCRCPYFALIQNGLKPSEAEFIESTVFCFTIWFKYPWNVLKESHITVTHVPKWRFEFLLTHVSNVIRENKLGTSTRRKNVVLHLNFLTHFSDHLRRKIFLILVLNLYAAVLFGIQIQLAQNSNSVCCFSWIGLDLHGPRIPPPSNIHR